MGVLCYDISPVFKSPAERPILLDKLTGNYGAYTAVVWEHYLVLSRGEPNRVEVIDFSDPTDLKHVTTIDTKGTPAKFGESSAWYVQAQDNFIFTQHQKIDMNTFKVVLELDQVGNNRPAGSASGAIDTSNYLLPLGNLLVTGGYSFDGQDCLGVWAHQAEPDTKKPYVGYHVPRPGQTNFPVGAPISLVIHESLESYTIINGETVILREVGTTTPINSWISFSHDDILTITPKQYLQANKTYEVVVVANGIKDPVGNGIEPYTFTFSTGSSITGGNAAPVITSFTASASPVSLNTAVTFTAAATDAENNTLAYRFNFGDGPPPPPGAHRPASLIPIPPLDTSTRSCRSARRSPMARLLLSRSLSPSRWRTPSPARPRRTPRRSRSIARIAASGWLIPTPTPSPF
jgi:hypothetical protein